MTRKVKTIGLAAVSALILISVTGYLTYNAGYQAGLANGYDAQVDAAKKACEEMNSKLQKFQEDLKTLSEGPNL